LLVDEDAAPDDPEVTALILRLAKRLEDKGRFNYSQECFDVQLQDFIADEAVDKDLAAQLKIYDTHAKVCSWTGIPIELFLVHLDNDVLMAVVNS
jgi:hypothetical protein